MDGFIESLYINKGLYSALLDPVCSKYKLTMTEMVVLLFLAKNSSHNTASNIVESLKITKSHVSASVRDLEERGYLQGIHTGHDRRTIHLQLREDAWEIIREGIQVQQEFLEIATRDFTEEEMNAFRSYVRRMNENANKYLKRS